MTVEDPSATTMIDLGPPAQRMADLLAGIPDERLGAPTPCRDTDLGTLVAHVGELAHAFIAAATKDTAALDGTAPGVSASSLPPDWRTRIPADLATLAEVWREPAAWQGMTGAGGVELPGEVAGLVALDELVIHGWDVARASAQPFHCDEVTLAVLYEFLAATPFADADADGAAPEGLFGPPVPQPEGAPLLHRVLGLTGRSPDWSPPA